jgi:hypothetical protein
MEELGRPTRCSVTQFILSGKLLYMLRIVPPPVTRSAYNRICSIWYLSHRNCYLPLSWKSWNAQQDATSHSLFYPENCSTRFGWYLRPSSGAHTTISTASGICHIVTATCRYRGRVGTPNKMQRHTVYFIWKSALHVTGGTSTLHQERIWYLSHCNCCLPLSW